MTSLGSLENLKNLSLSGDILLEKTWEDVWRPSADTKAKREQNGDPGETIVFGRPGSALRIAKPTDVSNLERKFLKIETKRCILKIGRAKMAALARSDRCVTVRR